MASRADEKRAAREAREAAEREAAARDARTRRLRLLGLAGAAAVLVVVLAVVLSSSGGGDGNQDAATRPEGPVQGAAEVTRRFAGIPQQGTTLGRPDAPVTLVEFADLKCPICRQFALQTLPTLIRDEVRRGRLRIEFRLQTFVGEQTAPGDSARAARFALAAARQGRFWPFVDLFYVNQGPEQKAYVTDALLRRLGGAVPGLDVPRALGQRDAAEMDSRLKADDALFVASGFQGTPSFLLGRTGSRPAPFSPSSLAPEPFTKAIAALAK